MTGVASRMFDKKERGMFMCIRCVTSTCLCTQDKHSSVASKMCASSKNVNIPTPPHPTPCHGFTKNHKTRGVANGAVGKNKYILSKMVMLSICLKMKKNNSEGKTHKHWKDSPSLNDNPLWSRERPCHDGMTNNSWTKKQISTT